ncbi:MAG: ATP-dependent DNA ligase [Actinomycetota bacterium]
MGLPITPPIAPQLARSAAALPRGDGWSYEPKFDGFRAIVFVDGETAFIQSRSGRPLNRYFPELVFPTGRYVLEGEIVVDVDGRPDFEALQQRIHPAESRVARLAAEIPATFIAFDLLAHGDDALLHRPFRERRARLAEVVREPVRLSPATADAQEAGMWLHDAEGVVAKELDARYAPGERRGMVKVKRVRTVDCVVVGWRPGKADGTLGALILGCYTPDGRLRVVGHSSGFSAAEKRALPHRLAAYETGGRGTGDPSRWTQGRDLEWIELRPELVVEVTFDHVSAGRIRHGAKVLRFRDDKRPEDCTVDQLDA